MESTLPKDIEKYILKIGIKKYYAFPSFIVAATPGADSVVLCHVLHELGGLKGIAHCNYGLRDSSDSDEWFVQRLAEKLEVPFYTKKFDTKQYAELWGITQQVATRRLRYAWLDAVRQATRIEHMATAFNNDEAIELLLINMTKGAGLFELANPLPRIGHFVRPLLFASKTEIMDYAVEKQLDYWPDYHEFQEDGMHAKVRQHLLPAFAALNPGFPSGMKQTLQRWHAASAHMRKGLNDTYTTWVGRNGQLELNIHHFKNQPESVEELYQNLEEYGFTYEQAEKMIVAKNDGSYHDKRPHFFLSATHRADVGSHGITLTALNNAVFKVFKVEEGPLQLANGLLAFNMIGELMHKAYRDESTCYLDADKLVWPLVVRSWRPDDSFQSPTSHTNSQSLHEYFKNKKLPAKDRDDHWVIWSGDKICAIAGQQADKRFMATEQSKNILAITWHLYVIADMEF